MSKGIISEEEKKEYIEIKIKIPKNTMAFMVNFIERKIDGIYLGNLQYDTDDIEELKRE